MSSPYMKKVSSSSPTLSSTFLLISINAPGDPVERLAKTAGNESGVEYYDVEITLEELAAYLFDDLELPDQNFLY